MQKIIKWIDRLFNKLEKHSDKRIAVGILTFGVILVAIAWFISDIKIRMPVNKPKIAVTILPLYDIVRNVAGDEFDVKLIAKAGANPYTYKLGADEKASTNKAVIVFMIGHGLDDWATKLAEAVGVKSVVTTDKQIEVLKNDVTDDPFYWLSVPNAMLISKSVEDELSKIAPSKAKIIKQNQNEYAKKLAKLDFELRKQLAGAKSLDLAVFHGGWNYFARDYGLNIVASLEPVAGKLPSEEQITDFQTKVKVSKLKNVFAEPQFADASFLSLVSKMGIKVTNLDSLGTSSQDTYESLMRANVQRIVDESQ